MEPFQREVLSAIADDYEEVEAILKDLRSWHTDQQIQKSDVADALQELVKLGLANAYELSAKTGAATVVTFQRERLNELYFLVSQKGRKELIG